MIRKLLFPLVFTIFFSSGLNAQVSIYTENFETAIADGNAENIAGPYLGWQNGQFDMATDNNYFWIFDDTRCDVITGNYSMAVSDNTPATTGILPQYDFDSPGNSTQAAASTLVYQTTPIDATNYTNVTLDFNWICEGETILGLDFDYGTVLYSLDANTWTVLPGNYAGQNTQQSVVNLDLSAVDGQIFYLGFGWDNDADLGGFPSFIIDDIDVKGIQLTPCTTPIDQPTGLILTSTGDTISGSFMAAASAPDNYLVVVSTSATPTLPAIGITYNIGDAIGGGTVVDIDNNTTFTATGLLPGTLYYIYVYSYNSICFAGPLYNTTSPLPGSITTTNSTYCTPSTSVPNSVYIDNVQFLGTLNDVSNLTNGFSTGYQDFTGLTNSVQQQGEGINIYVDGIFPTGIAPRFKAWVDWDKDGDFGNTASELVYDSDPFGILSTTFGFVIPANQPIGDYRIRIRIHSTAGGNSTYNFNPCEAFAGNGPNRRLGEAEDYSFTVVESCVAKIATITDGVTCGPGPVNLQVTGNASTTTYNLYDAETGGSLIASNTTGTFSPNITATATYWVTASDGNCESLKRLKIVGTLNPVTNLTINASTTICGEDDIVQITATGDIEIAYLIDEDFESGGLGVFTNNNVLNEIVGGTVNGIVVDDLTRWQNRTSTHVPILNNLVWFPAISSGFGANQFVMATSDVAPPSSAVWESLQSPILVDAPTFTDLTLSFDIYFSKYNDGPNPIATQDEVLIYDITGGTRTLITSYTVDMGNGTNFINVIIPLTTYISPNFRFSIDYSTNVDETSNPLSTSGSFGWNDGVAIDNIQVFGSRPLAPSFNWSAGVDAFTDATATIPYVAGTTAPTVYIKPTLTQLEQPSFTFTAFATLSNGCVVDRPITITNNTKIWSGAQGTSTWNDANNWLPVGVPTADNCVIVRDVGALPDPTVEGPPLPPTPAYARNLTVKSNGYLEIQPSTSLTVTDWIHVDPNGVFDVRNSANLVQVTNVAANNNTGSINMQREVLGLSSFDYVYWSSAVENFGVSGVSPGSDPALTIEWLPSVGGNGAGNYGEWQATSENMITGKGYAIKALLGTATANTAEFTGRPSNGIINKPITRGTYIGGDYPGPGATLATAIDDNWNLVGNPFPSSIYADTFITMNASTIIDDADPLIAGTVYLWRHQSAPSNAVTDPFYGDYVYNYNPNDYVAYNLTGSTPVGFNGFIGAGQAFFVLMDPGVASPSNLVFDNTMRSGVYDNNQFYRLDNSSADEDPMVVEKNRIWLDLIDNNNNAISILVGYISGATNEKDRLFDGNQLSGTNTLFYSLVDNEKMSIQGRSLPFNINDTVALGYEIPQNGNYSIAINNIDGLFETTNQDIFLEDTYTHTIHNLRLSTYSFTSESGTFNDRFILRYMDTTLSTNEPESLDALSIIAPDGKYIKIESTISPIESITLYDIMGRVVMNKQDVNNSSELIIETKHLSNGSYIAKVVLVDGKQKTQKVILKQ